MFDTVNCGDINGTDTGDRADVESAAAAAVGDVDWALVNQHGSAHSSNSTWVDTLQAERGIVSVGSDAPGYPYDDIDSRWPDTLLYRTTNPEGVRIPQGDIAITYARGSKLYGLSHRATGRGDTIMVSIGSDFPDTVAASWYGRRRGVDRNWGSVP